jgi:hypothetical protein
MYKLICIVVLLPFFSYGQLQLSGEIKNSRGEALPYANVLLLTPTDSVIVKGGTADAEGKFSLPFTPGRYLLEARMIGFQTYHRVVALPEDCQQGTIILAELSTELQEITVTAEKPLFEQAIDKLIVNVDQSRVGSGGTVLEVLDRSPGITIDRQGGSLSMNGKQGVQVMINGKLQRMPLNVILQQLEGMP